MELLILLPIFILCMAAALAFGLSMLLPLGVGLVPLWWLLRSRRQSR